MFEKADAERLSRIENAVGALINVAERQLQVEKRLSARLDALEAALALTTEAAGRTGAESALDERLAAAHRPDHLASPCASQPAASSTTCGARSDRAASHCREQRGRR